MPQFLEIENLKLFNFLCKHVSHSLSSPLGVLNGIFEDFSLGHSFSAIDVEDAQAALNNMRSLVVSIRELSIPAFSANTECLEPGLIEQVVKDVFGRDVIKVELTIAHELSKKRLDTALFLRALRALLNYFKFGLSTLIDAVSTDLQDLDLQGSFPEKELMTVSFCPLAVKFNQHSGGVYSLSELLEKDKSFQAVFLCFADLVFKVYRFRVEVRIGNQGEIRLVWFSEDVNKNS